MAGLEDYYSGRNPEGISGSDQEFQSRILAMINSLPTELQGQVGIISGYRSFEEQEVLYNRYLAGEGNLAAKPGTSNHNHGLAMDLVFHTNGARLWAHENGSKFGLEFPIASEAWHVEPLGLKDGTFSSNSHYDGDGDDHGTDWQAAGTDPSAYAEGDLAGADNGTLSTQLKRMADKMTGGQFSARDQLRVADPSKLLESNVKGSFDGQ